MHAHLKAGWTYSEFAGSCGGWELDGPDELTAVVCKETPRARSWLAFVVRFDDGATLFSAEHASRADAMAAAAAALEADTVRHAAASRPLGAAVAIIID